LLLLNIITLLIGSHFPGQWTFVVMERDRGDVQGRGLTWDILCVKFGLSPGNSDWENVLPGKCPIKWCACMLQ